MHQGRVKGQGIDCIGFIVALAHWRGYMDYDRTDYGREPMHGEMEQALDDLFIDVRTSLMDTHPGMLILFEWPNHRQHIALRTDTGIIHAYQRGRLRDQPGKRGAVVEHPLNGFWIILFKKAYQWRDLL